MPAFNFFNSFNAALAHKVHNLSADTLRLAFTLTAPPAAATMLSDLTEISYANLSGNPTSRNLNVTISEQQLGVYRLVIDNHEIQATANYFGNFRYIVIYNDTASNDEVIGWIDYGQPKRLGTGEFFRITFDQTVGLFNIRIQS